MRSPLLHGDALLMRHATGPARYEFHLQGEASDAVLLAFSDLEAIRHHGQTILTGDVRDQAGLFGVLDRIQAYGLELVAVRRVRSSVKADR